MLIITHRIKSSSEFMDRYLPDGPAGGFFLDEKLGMPAGSKICLELVLTWINETFYLYSTVERTGVLWSNCGREQKGAIVRLFPHEVPLRNELLERVRTAAEQVQQRGTERTPMSLDVHYFDERRKVLDGAVLDLSPTGAYIEAPRPLPTGSDVHLRFEDRHNQVMRHIRGRVVRLDFSGKVAGMGVAFHFTNRRERKAMRRLCEHLTSGITAAAH